MDIKEAIQGIKSDKIILTTELNNIGAYEVPKLKNKYNCPVCNSKDNLGIHQKNGEWRINCFTTGCLLNGDKNIIDTVIKYENRNEKDFYKVATEIAARNGIIIDNKKMTKEEKLKSTKQKIKKEKEKEYINKIEKEQDKSILEGNIKKCVELEKNKDEKIYTEYGNELLNSLIYNKNGTISIDQLRAGKVILSEYDFINNEKFFYKYDSNIGIWKKINKQGLSSIITNDLEKYCNYWSDSTTRGLTNFVFNKTYGNTEGEVFDQVFNKDPYKIVFKNGTLDLKNGSFVNEFNKEDYNTIVIPHNYVQNADIPTNTFAFLNMMTDDIKEVGFIFEWIGYLMVKIYDIPNILFLVGDGGNGKSTLIKLMTSIVGANNTSAVSMKSLINNKFQSALLYNKLFNTVADIGADFFDDSSILKALTGDDTITIERKGENGFSYLNFAKMTYSCNKLPKFKDTSGGLERRPIVLSLNKDFTNIVKKSGMHINDILNDEKEIESIISYSVRKFMQVIKNDKTFTESENMKKIKSEWLNDDPLIDFIQEMFETTESKDDVIEMAEFMGYYKSYCIDRNYKPMSQKNIVEAIKNNKDLHKRNIIISRVSNKGSKLKIQGLKKIKTLEWEEI